MRLVSLGRTCSTLTIDLTMQEQSRLDEKRFLDGGRSLLPSLHVIGLWTKTAVEIQVLSGPVFTKPLLGLPDRQRSELLEGLRPWIRKFDRRYRDRDGRGGCVAAEAVRPSESQKNNRAEGTQ